jgi:hypothetical protein
MAEPNKKSLMRNLGEFFGHIIQGAKTDPAKKPVEPHAKEIRRQVEEEDRGDMILRRTTIEEVEFKTDRDNKESDH